MDKFVIRVKRDNKNNKTSTTDDDFQSTVKSKHFEKKNGEKKRVIDKGPSEALKENKQTHKTENSDEPKLSTKRKSTMISSDDDQDVVIPIAAKKGSRANKKVKLQADKEEKPTPAKEKPAAKSNYYAMMNRELPKGLGTRPEPVGAPNCLEGYAFVISGVLETLTKEQTRDIIMRYGGRTTESISGKTSFLVLGRDAGKSKSEKAEKLGTKVLDEDAFYKLVESSSAKEEKSVVEPKPAPKKAKKEIMTNQEKVIKAEPVSTTPSATTADKALLWTEKHKPRSIDEIVGNKELLKKITTWLYQWNHRSFDSKPNDKEIETCRGVIISGPPGVGKTTAAHLISSSCGYEPLELNASDVRNKKILEEALSGMMENRTMTEFFTGAKKARKRKLILIMDEVDGMSAGDRGGSVELASQIKKSKIPVICICNDIRSTKVAPLLKVCFDARFRRTPANQIRSRIMSIAHKEKLDVKANAVDELVASTQNDIRQIINILSTYKLSKSAMDYDEAKSIGKTNNKNTAINVFDMPIEFFSVNSWRQKTLTELSDVYFHDYDIAPLVVQENYLKVKSSKPSQMTQSGNPREIACTEMDLLAKSAEAVADGDLVDRMIHGSTQQYSLMPVHAIMSCVRPAYYVTGQFQARTGFPGWLGQNSKAGKHARLLGELQARLRARTLGDKSEVRQNYVDTLNERIFGSIKENDFESAIEYMDNYYLDRESLETLNDIICTTDKKKTPMAEIPTKTKTSFTKKYNSERHPILFQPLGEPVE
ncbi:replication factor RFC1 C terminal domain-containing protein, partial [Sporodiniella umbellata]